jgi:hypothetical protein
MQPITILLRSSSSNLVDACSDIDAPDTSVDKLMLKCEVDGEMLFTAFITLTSGVAINLFSQWLYDKVKDKPNEKTVINGNQIFAETVNVIQITQIIKSPPDDGKDKGKTNS